jgi:hypothetical protein
MVVRHLDVEGVTVTPGKADAPLIVDSDAVLPPALASEFLKSVARRDGQIGKRRGAVDDQELPCGGPDNAGWKAARPAALEDGLGVSVGEGLDHQGEY